MSHDHAQFTCIPANLVIALRGPHEAIAFVCPNCDDTHLRIVFPDLQCCFEMQFAPKEAEALGLQLTCPQPLEQET